MGVLATKNLALDDNVKFAFVCFNSAQYTTYALAQWLCSFKYWQTAYEMRWLFSYDTPRRIWMKRFVYGLINFVGVGVHLLPGMMCVGFAYAWIYNDTGEFFQKFTWIVILYFSGLIFSHLLYLRAKCLIKRIISRLPLLQ